MKRKILIALTCICTILATLFLGCAIDRTIQPIMYDIDYIYENEHTYEMGDETITVKDRILIRFHKGGSFTIKNANGKSQGLYMITTNANAILREDVNIYTMLPRPISGDQFQINQDIYGVSSDKQTIGTKWKTTINPIIIDWSLFGVFCVGIVTSIIFIMRESKKEIFNN